MIRRTCIFLILALVTANISLAGDIQVLCEPGLRIYLDNKLAGTSSVKEDGFFLADVRNGSHIIRVEKEGFVPQAFEVEVTDPPIEVKVEALVPLPPEPEPAAPTPAPIKPAVGMIVITSAPQNCVVEIDGTRIETKNTPTLTLSDLVIGRHTISFSKEGYETISGTFFVQPGTVSSVRGNLIDGKVEAGDEGEGEGSVRVISKPTNCEVHFAGKHYDKQYRILNVSHIPAGDHRMVVEWGGRTLSAVVPISNGKRTIVKVSFMKDDRPFVITTEPK
jgi:hypothetical protein